MSAATQAKMVSAARPAAALGAVAAWAVLYSQLVPFSEWVVSLLPVERQSRLGEALAFFFYDAPKVLLLLTLVVFGMGIVRTWFSAERTRALLAGRREGVGNAMAAALGIVTPFCSCSAVPLFIGFVSAGVPLGVTFSFLIAAPMVNEVALGLLFALVGWRVALSYLAFGLMLAVVAGWVIGRLKLEAWLEPWVLRIHAGAADLPRTRPTLGERLVAGLDAVREIVGRVWYWVIGGIAAGALIHGYVPEDLLASIMGKEAWWSVPAAVIVGIPMYSNAAGIIPVVEALLGKGGGARHRARLHDERDRALAAGNDHPPQGAVGKVDRGVRRSGRCRYPCGRVPVQPAVRLRRARHEGRQGARAWLQAL